MKRIVLMLVFTMLASVGFAQSQKRSCIFGGRSEEPKSSFIIPQHGDTVETNTPTIFWNVTAETECFLVIAPWEETLEKTLTEKNVVVAKRVSGIDSIITPYLQPGEYFSLLVWGKPFDPYDDIDDFGDIICRICPPCCVSRPPWDDPWEPFPSPILFTVRADSAARATFIADFMTPEGEPHPFHVIISDGDWRQEWEGITHIETDVPLNATYWFDYDWINGNSVHSSKLRTNLIFTAGESREFEVFAHDPDSIEQVKEYVVGWQEKGANLTIENDWDEETMTLTVNVKADTGKTFELYGIINRKEQFTHTVWWVVRLAVAIAEWKASYCAGTTKEYYESGGLKSESTTHHGSIGGIVGTGPDSLGTGEVSIRMKFERFDAAELSGLGVYGAFYRDAQINGISTNLFSLEDGDTIQEQYFYPQYAQPQGHYLLQFSSPSKFANFDLPTLLSFKEIQTVSIYPPKIGEVQDFSFSVLAESPYAKSSYSNLNHDSETKTVTVDDSTFLNRYWWGCFVLPDTCAVKRIIAFSQIGDEAIRKELKPGLDYTDNPIEGHRFIAVRISPEVNSLSLGYSNRR